jgi:hypothetical protein
MSWWLWVMIVGLVIQIECIIILVRVRRETRRLLAAATERNEQSRAWLARARYVFRESRAILREHGFIVPPDPPDEEQLQ